MSMLYQGFAPIAPLVVENYHGIARFDVDYSAYYPSRA